MLQASRTLAEQLECSPMARETWVQIPGRAIPKTQKMVLDASLLNTQHYKVRIKGKGKQSREGVAPSPKPWCSSYRKGSQLFYISHYDRGTPNNPRFNRTLLMSSILTGYSILTLLQTKLSLISDYYNARFFLDNYIKSTKHSACTPVKNSNKSIKP